MFTHTHHPSWAVVGASSLWPFFLLKLTFPKSDTLMEVFFFPCEKEMNPYFAEKCFCIYDFLDGIATIPWVKSIAKSMAFFCHEQHIFTHCTSVGKPTDPYGKGKKLYSMVSQDLSVTHQPFCMEDLVLSFPLQFSLCFQHFICSTSTIIRANLQSHSGAIFICSGSRGLWFTLYNNGWIQGSIWETIL